MNDPRPAPPHGVPQPPQVPQIPQANQPHASPGHAPAVRPQPVHPAQVPGRPGPSGGGGNKIAPPPVMGTRREDLDLSPISLDDEDDAAAAPAVAPPSKIRMFNTGMGGQHNNQYKRQPCANGQGACRVRTFHGRLSDEGMAFLDDKVNEWLDGHPEIEVKFVNTSIGLYDGKIKEPALVMNVWY